MLYLSWVWNCNYSFLLPVLVLYSVTTCCVVSFVTSISEHKIEAWANKIMKKEGISGFFHWVEECRRCWSIAYVEAMIEMKDWIVCWECLWTVDKLCRAAHLRFHEPLPAHFFPQGRIGYNHGVRTKEQFNFASVIISQEMLLCLTVCTESDWKISCPKFWTT